ncbi:hypothetical protein PCC7418_2589 [Halothece sp. PCC 7418]|nr:hypothetical protein PCC7418_2589 [Halothece sp. PCC 7418]
MQRLSTLLAFLIIAFAMIFMAVISIQNITAISLQFLFFRSVEIPFGVLLAFGFSVGLILGAILPLLTPLVRMNKN